MFEVGDKVKVTKDFLLKLPHFTDRVEGGGRIVRLFADEASVNFYNGCNYHIFYSSLELKPRKNEQLLFEFME